MHTRVRSATDAIALVAVFVQMTELWRPLGFLSGLSSSTVNGLFAALLAVYCLINWRTMMVLFNKSPGRWWVSSLFLLFVLVLGLQMIDRTIDGSGVVYWTLFALLFTNLTFSTAVLWRRYGSKLVRRLVLPAIVATWIGFAVQLVDYGFIRQVLVYTSNRLSTSDSYGRLFGFYQHPNMAGFALCLFLACLVTDRRFMRANVFVHAVVLAACGAGVVVTGSRTSLLLFALVLIWYFVTLVRMPDQTVAAALRVFFAPVLLLGASVAALFIFAQAAGPESTAYANIMSRVSTIAGGLSQDQSVGLRLDIISVYIDNIGSSPLIGHAPGFARSQIDADVFSNVSQNSWLEWALRSGIPYAAAIAVAMISTLVWARRNKTADWVWPRAVLILGLFVVASFSIVNIFWLRAPSAVLGLLLGAVLLDPPRSELLPAAGSELDEHTRQRPWAVPVTSPHDELSASNSLR